MVGTDPDGKDAVMVIALPAADPTAKPSRTPTPTETPQPTVDAGDHPAVLAGRVRDRRGHGEPDRQPGTVRRAARATPEVTVEPDQPELPGHRVGRPDRR